jgi:hypothetical protein
MMNKMTSLLLSKGSHCQKTLKMAGWSFAGARKTFSDYNNNNSGGNSSGGYYPYQKSGGYQKGGY